MRSTAFYLGYAVWSVFWSTLSVLIGWALPLVPRYHFIIRGWSQPPLWWLRATCGIRVRVTGREHIPNEPCIFLVKHQSTWETLWMQSLVAPQAPLIKRELLRIPIWGWAFAMLKPIAIDRSNPRTALRQLIKQGRDRLSRGMYVTLFPEGTRLAPGRGGQIPPGRGGARQRNGPARRRDRPQRRPLLAGPPFPEVPRNDLGPDLRTLPSRRKKVKRNQYVVRGLAFQGDVGVGVGKL